MWFSLRSNNNNSYHLLGVYCVRCSHRIIVTSCILDIIILVLQMSKRLVSTTFIKSVSDRARMQTRVFEPLLNCCAILPSSHRSCEIVQPAHSGRLSFTQSPWLYKVPFSDMQIWFAFLQSPVLASSVFSLGFLEYIFIWAKEPYFLEGMSLFENLFDIVIF